MSNVLSSQARDPRYPIGDFVAPTMITEDDLRDAIATLAEFPEQLREALRDLDDEQLATPYREGGWTLRQVAHHVADSHATALQRTKCALTEDWPVVQGYPEHLFAELPDVKAPVEWPIDAIEAIHARWVFLLQQLTAEQWKRGFRHSERGPKVLDETTLQYAWHARHHLAHITHLRAAKGW